MMVLEAQQTPQDLRHPTLMKPGLRAHSPWVAQLAQCMLSSLQEEDPSGEEGRHRQGGDVGGAWERQEGSISQGKTTGQNTFRFISAIYLCTRTSSFLSSLLHHFFPNLFVTHSPSPSVPQHTSTLLTTCVTGESTLLVHELLVPLALAFRCPFGTVLILVAASFHTWLKGTQTLHEEHCAPTPPLTTTHHHLVLRYSTLHNIASQCTHSTCLIVKGVIPEYFFLPCSFLFHLEIYLHSHHHTHTTTLTTTGITGLPTVSVHVGGCGAAVSGLSPDGAVFVGVPAGGRWRDRGGLWTWTWTLVQEVQSLHVHLEKQDW